MTRFAFVAPPPLTTVSGGYAYDRAMIAALRDLGHEADLIATDMATLTRTDALLIVDGLAIPELAAALEARDLSDAVALVHHPTALETGRPEVERGHLIELETSLYARFPRVVVTSAATKDRLVADFGVADSKIGVVPPGHPDVPRSQGSPDGPCRILSIGTLVPRKGHDILLRCLARLFDLDWSLTIAGDPSRGPDHAQALVALAGELGIAQRVNFAGEVSEAELERLWIETDIFASATRFEGYGMAIADALRRGIPVAVTAGGAAGAMVTADAGTVCPLDDVDTFSKSLRRMIFDRELRLAMAERAWAIGRTLPDWPAQARAFVDAVVR